MIKMAEYKYNFIYSKGILSPSNSGPTLEIISSETEKGWELIGIAPQNEYGQTIWNVLIFRKAN